MLSFLINLDRSQERLQAFTHSAEEANLPFTRLSAIDGSRLAQEQLRTLVSPTFEFEPLNAGEIGLFLSHQMAWKKLLEARRGYAAVFEDDAVLAQDTGEVLRELEVLAPAGDIIKLETTNRKVVLSREKTALTAAIGLHSLRSWHGGTAGYVISARGAARLLHATQPLADPVDHVLFDPMSRVSASLRIFQVSPAVCIQQNRLDRAHPNPAFNTTLERHKTRGWLFRHGPWIDGRRAWKRLQERRRRLRLAKLPENLYQNVPFAGSGR